MELQTINTEKRKEFSEYLKNKLEKAKENASSKLYKIEGGQPVAKALYNFINKNAKWNFTESMGIINASQTLQSEVDKLSKNQKTDLELNQLTVEAIYYFCSKESGKGLKEALEFYANILVPISSAMKLITEDRSNISKMERDLGTLDDAILNNVNFENEDKFTSDLEKEILLELSKEIEENKK